MCSRSCPSPTYASATAITTRASFHHVADLQVPIGCGGVAVYPGDVLVADRDGIVVVPRAIAAEIAEPSLEQERIEAFVSTKIHAGEPLWGNYPPGRSSSPSTGRHGRRASSRRSRTRKNQPWVARGLPSTALTGWAGFRAGARRAHMIGGDGRWTLQAAGGTGSS